MKPYYVDEPSRITIYHGDCHAVLSRLPEASIDLTVTSPPYDSMRRYGQYSWDFEAVARELWRLSAPGAVVVWVIDDEKHQGSESGTSLRQALYFMELGFYLHDKMIYESVNGAIGAHNEYLQCFELMFVFSKGPPKTVNLLRDRPNGRGRDWVTQNHKRDKHGQLPQQWTRVPWRPQGRRTNIWRYQSGGRRDTGDHPAVFPLQLATDHICSWSRDGDVILDPFLGSGTTLRAAKDLGRAAIGVEIYQPYCDQAIQRLRQQVLPMEHMGTELIPVATQETIFFDDDDQAQSRA